MIDGQLHISQLESLVEQFLVHLGTQGMPLRKWLISLVSKHLLCGVFPSINGSQHLITMVSKWDDPPSTVSHYKWALYAVGLL